MNANAHFPRRCARLYSSGERGARLAERLKGALPTIVLSSHTALLNDLVNDLGAEVAFAQQVSAYGRPGDALLAISTSGDRRTC